MKQELIVAVAIRLFAVVLAFKSVQLIVYLVSNFDTVDHRNLPPAVELVFESLALALAYLLWRFPLTIARTLLPTPPQQEATDTSAQELLTAGVTLIGFWYTAQAIADLVFWIGFFSNMNSFGLRYQDLNPDQKGGFIATFFELAMGIWLMFGSRGLVGLVRWSRQAGTTKPVG